MLSLWDFLADHVLGWWLRDECGVENALPDHDPFDAEYKRRPSLGLSETRADEDEHQWLEWLLLLLGGLGLIVGIAFGAFVLIGIWRSIR